MKIERCEVVLNFRETDREKRGSLSGQYPHVVKDKIYWQLADPSEIAYAFKDGDSYKKPSENVILSNSLASQNFRVFYDDRPNVPYDERYKAVGGYHVGRSSAKTKVEHQKMHQHLHQGLNGCEISKNLDVIGVTDHVWPDYTRYLFKDDFFHPRHANGFYIFTSPDGLRWNTKSDKPFLSDFTTCEGESIKLSPDCFPSFFYDHNINEYVLYVRCNIKLGVRHVLYTKSKDLVNWDTPKLITKSPDFDMQHENLYYMGAYPLPNTKKYISFTPHFRNDILSADGSQRRYYDTKTLVMISDDGLNWKVVDEILNKEYTQHMRQPHVVSFREEEGEYVLYVHEGYWTNDGKLVKYKIDLEKLYEI